MKIKLDWYEAGRPGARFPVLTTPCPYNKIWLEERMAGSIACSRCEYFAGSSTDYVYCRRGDKRYREAAE